MNLKQKLSFYVNGVEHEVDSNDVSREETLNSFLRSRLRLTGTKRMCLEGGCGVCIVAVERKNRASNRTTVQAVNSCLIPIFSCDGWKVRTIEGLTTSPDEYHPLSKLLTDHNGSQCGFCSPGMVMNMYGLGRNQKVTMEEVENSFGGNICRCTGYRSMLSAFKSACGDADIEDLKFCQQKCEKLCKKSLSPTYFKFGKKTWIRVSLLKDLLEILKTLHSSAYTLVAGNTSTGVYKPLTESQVYVDITNVKELTSYKTENGYLYLGANLSLNETMEVFDKLAKENTKFAYLEKLRNHIDLVANVPVRNLGTLAGNLMIKYHHNEFPSDIFLIFETVGALLLLVDTYGKRRRIPIRDLLKSSMNRKVIEKIIIPSMSPNFHYGSYKIMPRAQNADALVNAGFLLALSEKSSVRSAKLVYGSINPSFVHATKTEQFLLGKELFNNDTLQGAFEILSNELVPNTSTLTPSPSFRKQLAVSLFYKYILSIAPKNLIPARNLSGANLLERPPSRGVQDFETKESMYPLTKPISKIESLAQTSGRAEYIMDMPDLPDQLFGAFVLAKAKPHSIIEKIDTTKAMKINGVVAFFSKDDIPGQNNFTPKKVNSVFFSVEEEIFCNGEVHYFNQPAGLIVATSQESAEKAANLVAISYNPATERPVLTIEEVLKHGNEKKTLQKEIKPTARGVSVKHVLKGSVELSWQYHFHMETQCCNVVPTEDGLDMYPSSQWLDISQTAAASVLNIPANKINVSVRRLGGGFGGKISRNSLVSCAAALAAYRLRKPVKIWLPFETNMDIVGKRSPLLCNYEMGIDDDGTIQYLDNTFYCDYGNGGNEPNIPWALMSLLEVYRTDTWYIQAFSTNTDNHASCYIRAPGTCEGTAMVEAIMEHAATTLNLDPLEFRLKNMDEKHELLRKFIKELHKWAELDRRKEEIGKFNEENRWKKKGLAVVPMVYPFYLFGNYGVIVSIYKSDGSVSIAHGGVEMGQGINTKAAQVCAFKLGVPLEKVSIKPSNNLIAPNAHMVGGSLTSETVCYAVTKACDILLKRIDPVRTEMKDASWESVVEKCYLEYIDLSATYMGNPKDMKNYTVYGVCASEIELDVLTGQHIVKRVDLLEDAGTSMNPTVDIGQVEGAFVMGMGYFTTEQIVFSEDGELLTNRTWNYKPPGAKDIPVDFRIKFPKNTPNDVGVLNSKAIGEPPLCLACSVPLAIRNAVASARRDSDDSCEKWFPLKGPSTVENVFLNCLNSFEQYTLITTNE